MLALARELRATAVVDEKAARQVGRITGIEVHGSIYLMVVLYSKGKMTKGEVIEGFRSMVKTGYRISPRDYTLIMEELEKI